jgi:hypothetical protein
VLVTPTNTNINNVPTCNNTTNNKENTGITISTNITRSVLTDNVKSVRNSQMTTGLNSFTTATGKSKGEDGKVKEVI